MRNSSPSNGVDPLFARALYRSTYERHVQRNVATILNVPTLLQQLTLENAGEGYHFIYMTPSDLDYAIDRYAHDMWFRVVRDPGLLKIGLKGYAAGATIISDTLEEERYIDKSVIIDVRKITDVTEGLNVK